MLYFSILVAACGSFLFGYTTCVIAGALLFLIQQFQLSDFQEGLLVSILLFGAMIGAIIGGRLHQRKNALIVTGAIFIVGILLSTIHSFEVILLGRAITGIGVGLASMLVPIYLAEVAPTRYRGTIGSLHMMGITLGLFSAYVINYLLSQSGHWQLMFGLALLPALILFIGMFFALDTSHKHASSILPSNDPPSLWSASNKHFVIMGVLLSLAQQATGINVVNYYAPKIFQTLGFHSPQAATYATLGIGLITVLAAFMATWLIDRWGRVSLLLISLLGMSVSLGLFSIAYLLHLQALRTIAILTLPAYTAFFTIGMGSALWVYLSEMYPSSIRMQGMSVATLTNWIGNYFITLVFPILAHYWGIGGVFAIFTLLCLIIFFLVRSLPDTKGKEIA